MPLKNAPTMVSMDEPQGKSEKALPPNHVEPKWPTPTMLRRQYQVPNRISNHITKILFNSRKS